MPRRKTAPFFRGLRRLQGRRRGGLMSEDRPVLQGIETLSFQPIVLWIVCRKTAPFFRGLRRWEVMYARISLASEDRPVLQGIETSAAQSQSITLGRKTAPFFRGLRRASRSKLLQGDGRKTAPFFRGLRHQPRED